MATITIQAQVLDGNLGDGWADNNKAAHALAEFTQAAWEADCAEFLAAGHDVEIDIDVQRSSGCSRGVSVMVGGADEESIALERSVEAALTSENTIWERFCVSDEAEELAE